MSSQPLGIGSGCGWLLAEVLAVIWHYLRRLPCLVGSHNLYSPEGHYWEGDPCGCTRCGKWFG